MRTGHDFTDDDLLTLELRVRQGEKIDLETILFLIKEIQDLRADIETIGDDYQPGDEIAA